MIETHEKIKIRDFEGLYNRGESDSVPPEYFRDCLNVVFRDKEVMTREGLKLAGLTGFYDLISGVAGTTELFLDIHVSYTGLPGFAVPIFFNGLDVRLADSSLVFDVVGTGGRFKGISAFGKFFFVISQSNFTPDNFFYVYPQTGLGRKLGGAKVPEAPAMTAVTSGAGKLERGTHVFRVVFETDTGFVTAPGATVAYLATANDSVDFAVIPLGPAGTAKRHIVATRAILNYNGDFANQEYFFIPNATLNNNSTVILNNIDFYDADLSDSVDFTLNQLAEIPSFSQSLSTLLANDPPVTGGIALYKNHLVLWTEDKVYVSAPDEPESYDSVSSIIILDTTLHGRITACAELRGSLYIWTSRRTFITNDNGGEPNTWELILIDNANGAFDNGVASVYLNRGNTADYLLVKNPNGVNKFVGVYTDELTSKIRKLYGDNIVLFIKGQISIDHFNQRIYTLLTSDTMLCGDYSRGMTEGDIRWSILKFTSDFAGAPNRIAAFRVFNDHDFINSPVFMVWMSNAGGNNWIAYILDSTVFNDNGKFIDSYMDFDMGPDNEMINHYAGNRFVATGAGLFHTTVYWDDRTRNSSKRNLVLDSSKKEQFVGFNVVSERLGLLMGTTDPNGGATSLNSWFCFRKLVVYWKELYLKFNR